MNVPRDRFFSVPQQCRRADQPRTLCSTRRDNSNTLAATLPVPKVSEAPAKKEASPATTLVSDRTSYAVNHQKAPANKKGKGTDRRNSDLPVVRPKWNKG